MTEVHRPASNLRRPRAVIFDMDGTLFDSFATVTGAYIATMDELAGLPLTPAEVVARYPLGPPINILRDLLGPHAADEHVATYHGHLHAAAPHLQVYPGIPELLEDLSRRDIPTGVFTGADTESCTMLVELAGLRSFFAETGLCGSDLVPLPKPDPAGLILTCARLGVEPRDVAYVGDSPLDSRCARSAGTIAVGATWGHLFDPDEPVDLAAESPGDVLALFDRP